MTSRHLVSKADFSLQLRRAAVLLAVLAAPANAQPSCVEGSLEMYVANYTLSGCQIAGVTLRPLEAIAPWLIDAASVNLRPLSRAGDGGVWIGFDIASDRLVASATEAGANENARSFMRFGVDNPRIGGMSMGPLRGASYTFDVIGEMSSASIQATAAVSRLNVQTPDRLTQGQFFGESSAFGPFNERNTNHLVGSSRPWWTPNVNDVLYSPFEDEFEWRIDTWTRAIIDSEATGSASAAFDGVTMELFIRSTQVPEPGSLLLLGVGGVGLALARSRRKNGTSKGRAFDDKRRGPSTGSH